MQAMISRSQIGPLADAFVEAWQRGYSWRTAIAQSLAALPDAGDIKAKLAEGVIILGYKPEDFDL